MILELVVELAETPTKKFLLIKSAFRHAQCPIFFTILAILVPKRSPPDY